MSDVIQNQELDRFELVLGGEIAGFTEYRIDRDTITFTHTEVEPDEREGGRGGHLAQSALDQVRANTDYRVIAQCPFTAHWIAQHPDYQDLLSR